MSERKDDQTARDVYHLVLAHLRARHRGSETPWPYEFQERVLEIAEETVARAERAFDAHVGVVREPEDDNVLVTPGDVARRFGVNPKTVARWVDRGLIAAVRTPGGHRRLRLADVERVAAELS